MLSRIKNMLLTEDPPLFMQRCCRNAIVLSMETAHVFVFSTTLEVLNKKFTDTVYET